MASNRSSNLASATEGNGYDITSHPETVALVLQQAADHQLPLIIGSLVLQQIASMPR